MAADRVGFTFLLVAWLFLVVWTPVGATDFSSTNFRVRDPVVAPSAGFATSTNFQNTATLGQPAIGISTSTSFTLKPSFLYFPLTAPPSSSPIVRSPAGSGGATGYYPSFPSPTSNPTPPDFLPQTPVNTSPPSQAPPSLLTSIVEGVKNFIGTLLPSPVQPSPPPVALPIVSGGIPLAFQGLWNLLPQQKIMAFVFEPLAQEVAALAEKFPAIGRAFKDIGVRRSSDLSKLVNTKFNLPGLMELIGMKSFGLPRGIPLANLLPDMKARIPNEIVFARTGAEKIDLPIHLRLQTDGTFEKSIRTGVGSALHLAVKPEYPSKRIMGYLVLKSRTRRQQAGSGSTRLTTSREQTPFQNKTYMSYMTYGSDMLGSLLFLRPVFAETARAADYKLLAGAAGLSYSNRSYGSDGSDTSHASDTTDRRAGSPQAGLQPKTLYGEPSRSVYGEPSRTVEERLVLKEFEYTDPDGDGIYTADVSTPAVDAEYEVITLISYQNPGYGTKEIRLTMVVDPEGYVFERNGDKETRIPGAIVSLFYLNPASRKYELWPGRDYAQENPQITDIRGVYAFLAPPGTYYISVIAPGYRNYQSKPFPLTESNDIHMNIEMVSPYGFLAAIDLKTIFLVLALLLIGYNFYKDKMREMRARQ